MRKIVAYAIVGVLVCAGSATAASTITGKQIKNNSVTGQDIKNRSLSASELSRGAIRSLRGQDGSDGAPGPAGTPGLAGVQDVDSASITVQPGQIGDINADCPAGKTVIGTGFFDSIADTGFVKAYGTFVGAVFENDTSIPVAVHVQAICASTSGAFASAASSRTAARRDFADDVAAFKQSR
jgi:hypothetical protein